MPLFDKIKAQAAQVAQMAQDAGKAGQAKIDQVQAKRQLDALYRDLGAAVYAERSGESGDSSAEIERLVGAITAHVAEHGAASGDEEDESPDMGAAPPEPPRATYGS